MAATKKKSVGQVTFEAHQKNFFPVPLSLGRLSSWDDLTVEMQLAWFNVGRAVEKQVAGEICIAIMLDVER